jgi:preprotein translocase subunit YajC
VGQYTSILLIVVMIVAFYFLIMRPQRKRQQQQVDMMKTLEPGSRVVTTTGIYATIVAVGDKQIVLETSPGSHVTMLKQAVGRVVSGEEEDAELTSYRTGAAAAPAAADAVGQSAVGVQGADDVDRVEETDSAGSSASGLAGGAPIQEYTPGAGPDFTAPASDQDANQNLTAGQSAEHETAPWPPSAPNGPAGEHVTGSTAAGSFDADSSLDDEERIKQENTPQENKDDASGR